ncbi:MAG: flavodoxin [Oscillospiraceae bacterium]|nr:flavodoxin [Oscillospiraceae bacterium]
MNKVAIVFWSGTGNTESMAHAVADGAKNAGANVSIFTAGEFSASMMDDFDAIAFGCPSMGAEQLEEGEFEPMFSDCESKLSGRKIALFGSYGWGDGEWMRSWEETCRNAGAELAAESVICMETPDDEAEGSCRALGAALSC